MTLLTCKSSFGFDAKATLRILFPVPSFRRSAKWWTRFERPIEKILNGAPSPLLTPIWWFPIWRKNESPWIRFARMLVSWRLLTGQLAGIRSSFSYVSSNGITLIWCLKLYKFSAWKQNIIIKGKIIPKSLLEIFCFY